jgi:hypothetical protein
MRLDMQCGKDAGGARLLHIPDSVMGRDAPPGDVTDADAMRDQVRSLIQQAPIRAQ